MSYNCFASYDWLAPSYKRYARCGRPMVAPTIFCYTNGAINLKFADRPGGGSKYAFVSLWGGLHGSSHNKFPWFLRKL